MLACGCCGYRANETHTAIKTLSATRRQFERPAPPRDKPIRGTIGWCLDAPNPSSTCHRWITPRGSSPMPREPTWVDMRRVRVSANALLPNNNRDSRSFGIRVVGLPTNNNDFCLTGRTCRSRLDRSIARSTVDRPVAL